MVFFNLFGFNFPKLASFFERCHARPAVAGLIGHPKCNERMDSRLKDCLSAVPTQAGGNDNKDTLLACCGEYSFLKYERVGILTYRSFSDVRCPWVFRFLVLCCFEG